MRTRGGGGGGQVVERSGLTTTTRTRTTHTQRAHIKTQTAIHHLDCAIARAGPKQQNAFHSVCYNQMFKLNFSFIHVVRRDTERFTTSVSIL